MKTKYNIITVALLILIAGCATQMQRIYQAENGIVSAVYRSMQSWASYYVQATNNPTVFKTTLPELEKQRKTVDDSYGKYQAVLTSFEIVRTSVSAGTMDETNLVAALYNVSSNAAVLQQTILIFTTKP